MKVLFILEYYEPNVGGVEKLFKTLAESLVEEGHEVNVLTNRFDNKLKAEKQINGVKVKRVQCINRFLFTLLSIPAAIKAAKDCDLIHTSSYNAAIPARIAAKFHNKKSIITFHEVWDKLWLELPFINYNQKLAYRSFEKLILRFKFDRFIAVSEATKASLIEMGVNKQKLSRIYNGIDYPNSIPEPKVLTDNFTFTYLGRLGISKGLDLLIPAARQFISEYPDARLKLICPDQPKSMLRKIQMLIKKYNIETQTSIIHSLNKSKIEDEIQNSNCIVIPSYSEGFCFVAAEAVALGVPIISSGKKALSEVVSGKEVRIEVLSSEGIYKALLKAKNNNYSETPIRKFELSDCVNAYLDLYSKL